MEKIQNSVLYDTLFLKDGEGKTLREFCEQRFSLKINTSHIQILAEETFHRMFKVTKIL